MKKSFRLSLFLLLQTLISPLYAGGLQTGTVTQIGTRNTDGLTWVYLSGTASGKPACATNIYWMIPNPTTDVGKRIVSILLAARAQGNPVTITGAGTCTTWGDGEDISWVTY